MNIGLQVTPLGSKVKFTIQGQLVCSRQGHDEQLRKSITLDKNDLLVRNILGGRLEVKKFLNNNRRKNIIIHHNKFFVIDGCDRII